MILKGGRYGTALQAGSETGHLEIVKMLLAAGGDPNTQGVMFGDSWFISIMRQLKAASTEWLSKQRHMLDTQRSYNFLLRTEQT